MVAASMQSEASMAQCATWASYYGTHTCLTFQAKKTGHSFLPAVALHGPQKGMFVEKDIPSQSDLNASGIR